MKIVIRLTIFIVLIGYVFIGILGYATFANNLEVLVDPDKSNGVILIAYGYDLHGQRRPFPFLVVVVFNLVSIYSQNIQEYCNNGYFYYYFTAI